MDVDDPVPVSFDEISAQQRKEACQYDKIDIMAPEVLDERFIVILYRRKTFLDMQTAGMSLFFARSNAYAPCLLETTVAMVQPSR